MDLKEAESDETLNSCYMYNQLTVDESVALFRVDTPVPVYG